MDTRDDRKDEGQLIMPEVTEKRRLHVHVPAGLLRRMKILAAQQDTTVTAVAVKALQRGFSDLEREGRLAPDQNPFRRVEAQQPALEAA